MEDKISIIITSYNYAQYISEAIDSVINQTYKNWELIVFDDGSTDNSVEIIKEYCKKDNRIKLFQHENGQNNGLPETVKQAVKQANCEWIVFLESDDSLTIDYLEEKIKVIKQYPKIGFIFNDVHIYGDVCIADGYEKMYKNLIQSSLIKLSYPSEMFKVFQTKSGTNFIPTFSVVMLNKKYLTKIDFNTPINQFLDWYLWLQIISKSHCLFFYVNKKLTNWRRHSGSYVHCAITKDADFIFRIKKAVLLHKYILALKILIKYRLYKLKSFIRKCILKSNLT